MEAPSAPGSPPGWSYDRVMVALDAFGLVVDDMAATLGFVFTAAWSELLFALMLINSEEKINKVLGTAADRRAYLEARLAKTRRISEMLIRKLRPVFENEGFFVHLLDREQDLGCEIDLPPGVAPLD